MNAEDKKESGCLLWFSFQTSLYLLLYQVIRYYSKGPPDAYQYIVIAGALIGLGVSSWMLVALKKRR